MPPAPSRRSRRSSTAAVAVVATAMALAACAPITGRGDDAVVNEVAAGAQDPSTGQAAASAASLEAASEAAASEAAASEAAASEAAASEAAASEAAASEAAASEAAREAAEAEAARKAASEAAAKKAAEEVAAKKAAEEAAEKKAAEEAAEKKAVEEAAAEAARKKAEREAREAREVQTVLADLGYYTGGIDGDVGSLTQAAIEDFQGVNGLEVDGVVGPNTEAALASDDALPKPPPPPPDDDEDADEDDGEDGDDDEDDGEDGDSGLPDGVLSVEVAQQELVDLGYYLGPVDGDRSDALAYALQAFQQVNGITADGILGPGTSDALRDPVMPKLVGGSSTRIEIDLDLQVIHLVKGDTRVRTMPTSTGNGEQYLKADGDTANAKTPVGTFTIQRRIEGERVADLGTLYDPMYFYKGWAIHGSNSVPPYPASHGCTRLPRADALWLWDQVPNGTTVIIHGGEHTFIPTG